MAVRVENDEREQCRKDDNNGEWANKSLIIGRKTTIKQKKDGIVDYG